MFEFGKFLLRCLFDCGPGWIAGRAAVSALFGLLLYFQPVAARRVVATLVFLPLLAAVVPAFGAFLSRHPKPRLAGGAALAALAGGGVFLAFQGLNRLALWGAALWALLAALSFFAAAAATRARWQLRLFGVAGGALTLLFGWLFVSRRDISFLSRSDLFGAFFLALALLALAAIPWGSPAARGSRK